MAMNISNRRNSSDQLQALQAEIKRRQCCTHAAVRAHSFYIETKEVDYGYQDSTASTTASESIIGQGVFSKIKETVSELTHDKIKPPAPIMCHTSSGSEELLVDFPSKDSILISPTDDIECSKEAKEERNHDNTAIDQSKKQYGATPASQNRTYQTYFTFMPSKSDELLVDFPSTDSFWKSISPTKTECSQKAPQREHSSTSKASKENLYYDNSTAGQNIACAAHFAESGDLILESDKIQFVQHRRRSMSLSMLSETSEQMFPLAASAAADGLSHFIDSPHVSVRNLSCCSSNLSRGSSEDGGSRSSRDELTHRRGCVGMERASRRRSSHLLELDNAQHYGGLCAFGN